MNSALTTYCRWLRLADTICQIAGIQRSAILLSVRLSVCSWLQKNSTHGKWRMENPVLLAWLPRRITAAEKNQRGLRTQPAAMLRSVWRPTHRLVSWRAGSADDGRYLFSTRQPALFYSSIFSSRMRQVRRKYHSIRLLLWTLRCCSRHFCF